MPTRISWSLCATLCIFPAFAQLVNADEAASNYLFAALELRGLAPDYVDAATTDDPDRGFAKPLSDRQVSSLKRESVASALKRFDAATSCSECVWSRYNQSTWSDAGLAVRLHQLARVVLLRARVHYEAGRWIEGNRSVERVRIMARRMALQARPWENQCFMIENMANGTAAAYLLQFPPEALDDLLERHRRVGKFSPKAAILAAEAERLGVLADDYENGKVTTDKLLEFACLSEEVAKDIAGSAPKDAAAEIRQFSQFLKDQSQFLELEQKTAEQSITETYHRYSQVSHIVASQDEPSFGEYRENAQAICRDIMMEGVIKQLLSGGKGFANIKDPYSSGPKPFEFQKEKVGFRLVSELQYFPDIESHIFFQFGLAGSNRPEKSSRQSDP